MKYIAAFPNRREFEKMQDRLAGSGLPYEIVNPEPGCSIVDCPAVVVEQKVRSKLLSESGFFCVCAGWVEFQPATGKGPDTPMPVYQEEIFGRASITVLAPCVADFTKIRLIAYITGDLTEVFPYLNSEMPEASYNREGPFVTFMDHQRLITLYPRKIAVAKADEIIDGWRALERIRRRVNEIYGRRHSIEPCYEMRTKPAALHILKRLPGTNCGQCGQLTCIAFALMLWSGRTQYNLCRPIFEGEHQHLRDAYLEICAGLGVLGADSRSTS